MVLQVDEAREVLLGALSDVWPEEDHLSVFAKTVACICLRNGFAIGKTAPYYLSGVPIANLSTHLHKSGMGMTRSTYTSHLKKPELSPYLQIFERPKSAPEILLMLANVFNGHPSSLVHDIVQQTFTVHPQSLKPLYYAATVMSPMFRARY